MGGGLQKDNGKCQQIISFLSNLIDGLALENILTEVLKTEENILT